MRALYRNLCCLAVAAALTACANKPPRSLPHNVPKPAQVVGGLRPDQIQSAIERGLASLESAATDHWPGAGKVQLSFAIGTDGFAHSVKLTNASFENPELVRALENAMRQVSFPSAKSETLVSYYPVYFR